MAGRKTLLKWIVLVGSVTWTVFFVILALMVFSPFKEFVDSWYDKVDPNFATTFLWISSPYLYIASSLFVTVFFLWLIRKGLKERF